MSFVCDNCELGFSRKDNFKRHMRLHDITQIDRMRACPHCDRKVSDDNFARHVRRHSANLQCKMCDRTFNTKSSLQRHTRIHTGVKPFECPVCMKRFTQSSNMKIHVLTHTGTKPPSRRKIVSAFPECKAADNLVF